MFQPSAFQSDAFQETGAPVVQAAAATGGWPIYYPRRKRKEAEPADVSREATTHSTKERVEQLAAELASRRALRIAEQRDQRITQQLRAIYAEQDALARSVAGLEALASAAEDDDEVMILAALG